MDQKTALRVIGFLAVTLLTVAGWAGVEMFRVADSNADKIQALSDRVSTLEGRVSEIRRPSEEHPDRP